MQQAFNGFLIDTVGLYRTKRLDKDQFEYYYILPIPKQCLQWNIFDSKFWNFRYVKVQPVFNLVIQYTIFLSA